MSNLNIRFFKGSVFLLLGVLGLIWFFIDMNHHWVPSTLDMKDRGNYISEKADSVIRNLGDWKVMAEQETRIDPEEVLIDSLQSKYGTRELMDHIANPEKLQLPFFRWVIDYRGGENSDENPIHLKLDPTGKLIQFESSFDAFQRQNPVNKRTVQMMLGTNGLAGMGDKDSLLSYLNDFRNIETEQLEQVAAYYIKNSFWGAYDFVRDSLLIEEDADFSKAELFYSSRDTVLGFSPRLELEITPQGSLYRFEPILLTNFTNSEPQLERALNLILSIMGLVFAVWLLTVFYLRIKARAIDTRPSLVVALIGGFMVSGIVLLEFLENNEFSLDVMLSMILPMGVAGGMSAVGFFLLTAVSDSITRQYWPEKLRTWDLVRNGMLRNQPVGWSLLQGIALGGIMVGAFVLLLHVFPEAYLNSNFSLDSQSYVLGSMAVQFISLLISFLLVVCVFMIVTNQLKGLTDKTWIAPIVVAVCFGIVEPLRLEISPIEYSLIFNLIIGFMLGVFYLYFDFLALVFGFFTFFNLVLTKKGWLITNSPDFGIFLVFMGLLASVAVVAFVFIFRGNEQDVLPDYVPEYIEDLAKEQRVRQELAIARTVQKTFLPNTTPDIPGFDTSALCDPAMDTGGDYYDIICLDDDRAAIAIGDVSGKGIRAAFYMTFAKGVIHSLSTVLSSPKELMSQANRLFNNNATRGTFISMIYGVLDIKSRTFTYVRAGHNPMLYKKASGEISWPQPKGVALGMAKGDLFEKSCEEVSLQLEKGDVLVLYTDGVTEAQNAQGEFFGEERLEELLKKEKTQSSKELRNFVVNEVRAFCGETTQYDDMTLVVIKA